MEVGLPQAAMGSKPTLKSGLAAAVALTLVLAAFATPAASKSSEHPDADEEVASLSEPRCLQIYLGVYEVGPVTVDASDSCPEVYVDTSSDERTSVCLPLVAEGQIGSAQSSYADCGATVSAEGSSSPSEALTTTNCIQIWLEFSAGPATVTYNCSDGADASVDDSWSSSDGVLAPSEPQCFDIYFQKEAGPVTVTATSSCSASADVDEDWRP